MCTMYENRRSCCNVMLRKIYCLCNKNYVYCYMCGIDSFSYMIFLTCLPLAQFHCKVKAIILFCILLSSPRADNSLQPWNVSVRYHCVRASVSAFGYDLSRMYLHKINKFQYYFVQLSTMMRQSVECKSHVDISKGVVKHKSQKSNFVEIMLV